MSGVPPPDRSPARTATGFSPEWLAAQRWFRRKSRGVAGVTLVDSAPLPGGHGWLLVLAATDADGVEDRYLVPAAADGGSFREPRDGEGIWRRLASLIATDAELRAERGQFAFSSAGALRRLLPGGAAQLRALGERRLGVEQSNTSVALGDRLILKCYRLLERGANPEIEVNAFLTDARFRGTPSLGGRAEYVPDDGPPCAVAMLQELVPSRANGWGWALERLGAGARERASAVAGIAQLGTLTRALHAALGSRPEVPGFPSRSAVAHDLASWHAGAARQLDGALGALTGEARRRLLAIAPGLRDRLEAILGAGAPRVTRIHGDYHLGQVLRTARGFKVIDFEGEPARPLAERREPASPLRDVAGMLRSIDYAARVSHRQGGLVQPEAWVSPAREAFLSSYGPISTTEVGLLEAFLIEKACYEVRYEADNRPDWVWVPLDALERQASRPD
jgi:trehalose synthase-fused probable maltokinase